MGGRRRENRGVNINAVLDSLFSNSIKRCSNARSTITIFHGQHAFKRMPSSTDVRPVGSLRRVYHWCRGPNDEIRAPKV
jgi:hypothetical protein